MPQNADGVVGPEQLLLAMKKIDPALALEDARGFIGRGDKDGDGALTEAEFRQTLSLSNPKLQDDNYDAEQMEHELAYFERAVGIAYSGGEAAAPAAASGAAPALADRVARIFERLDKARAAVVDLGGRFAA